MQKIYRSIFLLLIFLSPSTAFAQVPVNDKLFNWLKSNISPQTGLPYSFYIKEENKQKIFAVTGDEDSPNSIIERVILNEGLVIYDGAVSQMALLLKGDEESLRLAHKPVDIYWDGTLHELHSIRAGYPHGQFMYDPARPEDVSSRSKDKGTRGFIFRIINANGKYFSKDPLDGKLYADNFPLMPRIHWEDWKPVAGENAWVVMAALQLFHRQYYDLYWGRYFYDEKPVELLLSEELARAALFLQADNGAIRMAPLNTYREALLGESGDPGTWWYNQISTENNISWYAAFRMLYEITGEDIYREAMNGIEGYLKSVYSIERKMFYQGARYEDGEWIINEDPFALDVQTWVVACLGPSVIDEWFGEGASYAILNKALQESGAYDASGRIMGVGFTSEHDRVSVEWSAGAVLALREAAAFYRFTKKEWAVWAEDNAKALREGVESLRQDIGESQAAYAYSSRRGWIPFGWYSHGPDVLSTASTGWIIFNDTGFNPFVLENRTRSLATQD